MSISLYCGRCRKYMGHHNPDAPRDYDGPADGRRDYDNVCQQCEAIEGLFEARIHARRMWNSSMRAHAHVIDACRRTIAAINPGYQPRLWYSIGTGGYTVLEPKQTHMAMLQKFTDQDALCILELGAGILTCPENKIGEYHVSQTFAIWCALMRHIECSKMNREDVRRIVTFGVNDIRQAWKTWRESLTTKKPASAPAAPGPASARPKRPRIQEPQDYSRKQMMTRLGSYFSGHLNRSEAQAQAPSQRMAYTRISRTPPRDDGF